MMVTKFAPVLCGSLSEGTGEMNGCRQNQSDSMNENEDKHEDARAMQREKES
jgi:hypothetical protein